MLTFELLEDKTRSLLGMIAKNNCLIVDASLEDDMVTELVSFVQNTICADAKDEFLRKIEEAISHVVTRAIEVELLALRDHFSNFATSGLLSSEKLEMQVIKKFCDNILQPTVTKIYMNEIEKNYSKKSFKDVTVRDYAVFSPKVDLTKECIKLAFNNTTLKDECADLIFNGQHHGLLEVVNNIRLNPEELSYLKNVVTLEFDCFNLELTPQNAMLNFDGLSSRLSHHSIFNFIVSISKNISTSIRAIPYQEFRETAFCDSHIKNINEALAALDAEVASQCSSSSSSLKSFHISILSCMTRILSSRIASHQINFMEQHKRHDNETDVETDAGSALSSKNSTPCATPFSTPKLGPQVSRSDILFTFSSSRILSGHDAAAAAAAADSIPEGNDKRCRVMRLDD